MDSDVLEHYIDEKANQLENRIKVVETAMYILVFTVFSVAVFFNLFVTSAVPKFKKIFEEMLEGEPLPWLTEMALTYSTWALSIEVLFAFILIILCAAGKLKYFLTIGIFFTVLLFVKMTLLYISMFLPLIVIINKLGGG